MAFIKKRADEFEAKLSEKSLKEEQIIKNTKDLDEKIQKMKKESLKSIKETDDKSIKKLNK